MCCHENFIRLSLKRLRAEVEYSDSLDTQLTRVELNIQVTWFSWPSTNIHFMESMRQFVCLHSNVWLYGLSYTKSSYIVALSLGL